MKSLLIAALAVVASLVTVAVAYERTSGAPSSCESLASLTLAHTAITIAQPVDAGRFALAGLDSPSQGARSLPGFCRVGATLTPSSDSDIKMELWMPATNWNGKFQAVGNGAFSGAIAYPAMMAALARGYATASTDTGHAGGSASFALGHPEKAIDFGWRAVHEMTVTSKQIVATFYSGAPKHSYWNGCSAGGRQGMKEAQRFPADFDGIIAGSPGLDWTGRAAQAVRLAQALQRDERARLSPADAQLVHRAVLDACDAQDGVKDSVIDDPKRCAFDPGVLQCTGSTDAPCLTPAKVVTVRMLYSAQTNPRTNRDITGLERGSELGWTDMGWSASARATGLDQFRFLVFKDPRWDVDQFNFDADIVRAEETDDNTINALDPNLAPFIDRGGKLLQYHGWSDPQISPGNSTQYYQRVMSALGGARQGQDSYRLFMAPGMAHCGGGDGPNSFDAVGALEAWVEEHHAPDRIVASHVTNGKVDRTRPLCPYPQIAVYLGSGSTDEAASFTCRTR
jgi:feruloyl esterase